MTGADAARFVSSCTPSISGSCFMSQHDTDADFKTLLEQTLTLSAEQRGERIAALHAQDPKTAEALRQALTAADATAQAPAANAPDAAALQLDRLGGFKVLSLIGQGGMGSVFLAEQDNPRRKVALKVMRQTGASHDAAHRFRREAAALALLDHPGIAKVYAAGIEQTPLGTMPYLAMEFVDGVSLLEHAANQALDRRQRLQLVVSICQAVQHAHQRGVVHRDLKPANILVDRDGDPRVLDFGIARLLDDTEGASRLTQMGELVGTLPYMSPEQLNGDPAGVDTRADVYALGVILYELLSGKRPREFEAHTSLLQAIARAMRTPMRSLGEVNPACAGELETITMKALAEAPEERYASASELGADIQRYLRDEPILARPPSAWYVIQKFARRHRALVAISMLGVAALLASTGFAINAAWRERDAREAAERSAAISASVQAFMNDMFQAALPESALGREVSVREIVDQASLRLQHSPPDDPLVAAQVGISLSQVNLALGRIEQAQVLINGAGATLDKLGEEAAEPRLQAAILSLRVHAARQSDTETEQSARDLIAEIDRQRGPSDPLAYETGNLLGDILQRQSRFAEAIDQYRQVLDAPLNLLPADHQVRESALGNLATALRGSGDLQGAIAVLTQLQSELTARHGPDHPNTLTVVNNLAIALQNSGERERAGELYQRAYEGRSLVLGANHPDTLNVLQNQATLLIQSGRSADAAPILRRIVTALEESRLKHHPAVLVAMNSLAYALEDLGELDEAETIYRETLALQLASNAAFSESFGTRNNLAMLLMRKGDLPAAEKEFITVLDAASEKLGADHVYVQIFANNYGECLMRLRQFGKAEGILLRTQSSLSKAMGAESPRVAKARARLAELYDAMGKPDQAAAWRKPLEAKPDAS